MGNLKTRIKRSYILSLIVRPCYELYTKYINKYILFICNRLCFSNWHFCIFHRIICECNHTMVKKGKNSIVRNLSLYIKGDNILISIGDNVRITDASFYIVGNNSRIVIGNGVSITDHFGIALMGNDKEVIIGEDCMISNHVEIRTSDAHPIYNIDNQIINKSKSVIIGDHVWIAAKASIMKGVTIGEGSVIGMCAIVTKDIPPHSLAVGIPAKVCKKTISWEREILSKNEYL